MLGKALLPGWAPDAMQLIHFYSREQVSRASRAALLKITLFIWPQALEGSEGIGHSWCPPAPETPCGATVLLHHPSLTHESREGSECLLAPLARVTGPGPCLHLTPGLQSHSDQSWGCAEPPGLHGLTCVCIKQRNSFLLVLSPSSCACAHLHCSDKDVPTRPETASSGRSQYLWGGKEKKSSIGARDRKGQRVCFPSSDLSNAASGAQSRNPIQTHSSRSCSGQTTPQRALCPCLSLSCSGREK